jgi:hypothetical protein
MKLVRHTQKPTISKVRAIYQRQNIQSAEIILQRIGEHGGEGSAMVRWARLVRAKGAA